MTTAPSPPPLRDGITVISDGIDSGNAPEMLPRSKLSWAVNCSLRGGYAKTRPSFVKRAMTGASSDISALTSGLFQGAAAYLNPASTPGFLAVAIAGNVFLIDPGQNFSVLKLAYATAGPPLQPNAPRCWMETAEQFLIVQDGYSLPLITDGGSVWPSNLEVSQVPVMTIMKYVNGRLWGVLPGTSSFVAGDLVGSSSGSPLLGYRDAVLYFTQNALILQGGSFSVPVSWGPIRAMSSFAQVDISTGQGPLQVLTTGGGFSINAPPDRTTWQNLTYPIQTVSMGGPGAESHESAATVNGDIWFRSSDGLRSFQTARRDIGMWSNTPMSFEVTRALVDDDPSLVQWSSAANHDSRYLVTVGAERIANVGVGWRGLIALDFTPVSQFGATGNPNYDGIWTGLTIMRIVEVGTRCFLWVYNQSTTLYELWEIESEGREERFGYDNDGVSAVPIQARIETGALDFGTGAQLKQLDDGFVWASRLAGTVNFTAWFKPDYCPTWTQWTAWSENCLSGLDCTPQCPAPPLTFPSTLVEQYRPAMCLGRPPQPQDPDNQTPGRNVDMGYFFQVALDITGPFRLGKFEVLGHIEGETPLVRSGGQSADTTGVTACYSSYGYTSYS